MKEDIEIYTDGSSLGNPGLGGWGVVVVKNSKIVYEFGGYQKETTNNRMELVAAIETLKYILQKYSKDNIVIYTDSSYVLLGITVWINNWEKNNWKTANKKPVLNRDLWEELIGFIRIFKGKISWQKVKGHSGHVYNEKADLIATQCSSLQKKHSL